MSFKDSLSKFTKDLGDGVMNIARKSGEAVEVTKLNLEIKSEEENIDDICIEMGRLIYRKYQNKENIDLDHLERCKKIDHINKSIEELKCKILEIKNIRICKTCNTEIDLGIEFCPKCGSRQKLIKKKSTQRVCPECKVQILGDGEYCHKCGSRLKL